jgi:ribose/xylose/arabinose/galactoside ABC-type transport system permease subunit
MSGLRHRLRTEVLLPITAFAAILVAFLFVPGLTGDEVDSASFYNALQGFAPLGLVALALGLTLLAGEFDVSVLGMQALGGVLAVRAGEHHGLLGVLAAVAGCALLGLGQGLIIARLHVQSLSLTIGTYVALLGLTNVIAGNDTLSFTNVGASVWVDQQVLSWFSPRSLIAIGAFAVVFVVLAATRLGPEIKALGSDRRAARVSGVPVQRRLAALFACSGLLAGLAGALLAYSNASASLNPGLEPLILATAAAVLGGFSLSGGRGTMWGLLLGALAVALLQGLFAITALPTSTTQIVFGALLLIVVTVDAPQLRVTLTAFATRRRTRPERTA